MLEYVSLVWPWEIESLVWMSEIASMVWEWAYVKLDFWLVFELELFVTCESAKYRIQEE